MLPLDARPQSVSEEEHGSLPVPQAHDIGATKLSRAGLLEGSRKVWPLAHTPLERGEYAAHTF